ncbi:MAG: hypothetical protein B7733_16630 [Myxococcales bacterium FL481]|nr:MAG: hypothetical protein B7733_16630 [Myxococcales bacterium FL481]
MANKKRTGLDPTALALITRSQRLTLEPRCRGLVCRGSTNPLDAGNPGLPRPGGLRDKSPLRAKPELSTPDNSRKLRQLAHAMTPGRVRDLTDDQVKALLETDLANDRLFVRHTPEPAWTGLGCDEFLTPYKPGEPGPDEVAPPWTKMPLHSPHGEPRVGERYTLARLPEDKATYGIRLVGPDGQPLSGISLGFAKSSGQTSATTNAEGVAAVTDVGDGQVKLHPPDRDVLQRAVAQ